MSNDAVVEKINELVAPIVSELGYELYFIEYVKENNEYYLRIYIDNDKGINLDDCEKVSRPISDILDLKDPISDSYYLEVSSPGINRGLYTDKHLTRYRGSIIRIKLDKPIEGKKIVDGILIDFTEADIIISINNNEIRVPRIRIKAVNLEGEL
jgi:ribosome maturation factor RimP